MLTLMTTLDFSSNPAFAMMFAILLVTVSVLGGLQAAPAAEAQYPANTYPLTYQSQQQPVVGFTVETNHDQQYPYISLRRDRQQYQPEQPSAVYAAAPPPPPGPNARSPGARGRALQQWGYNIQSDNLVAPPPQRLRPAAQYPLTPPSLKYRIGVISDQDKAAALEGGKLWEALLKEGFLDLAENRMDPALTKIEVGWTDSKLRSVKSGLAYSGRGMELSTLNAFQGKLYSCDDKTGVVYELPVDQEPEQDENEQGSQENQKEGEEKKQGHDITPIPWAILADGNSEGPNGFKCEWGTVKDDELWIGGHGKHVYNDSGVIISSKDRFIKKITATGAVTHLDWSENFDKMQNALGIQMPGYVIHEAAGWSDVLQKWIFMPRKVSKEQFDVKKDETAGSNVMLIADENFNEIEVVEIGTVRPTEGFSGFKFVPGTNDQYIVALKTEETESDLRSFILAFDLKGNLLLNETEISGQKFEAIEFL